MTFIFTSNRDGSVPSGSFKLVNYINTHGSFRVNGFEVGMSKDKKFINRKRL